MIAISVTYAPARDGNFDRMAILHRPAPGGDKVLSMSGGIKADTTWMRACAADCDSTAAAVKRLLGPADDTTDRLRQAASGWGFLGSLDDMTERWEKLNKLLRDELEEVAEDIRFCASNYDGHENIATRTWHELGKLFR